MSVWLKITPAALTLSASTPMVHIIALVRQGILETDETAQVRVSCICYLNYSRLRLNAIYIAKHDDVSRVE